MSTRTTLIVSLILIAAATLAGVWLWPQLPERMASHWNIHDEVDGTSTRFWGVFLMPLISIAMLLLFLFLPLIDPLKKNIEAFRGTFNLFIFLILAFLIYIYGLTLVYNLGTTFRMSTAMLPGLGLLYFYAGVLISKARRNWFIGIRTPWTLSNDRVWDETHRLGGWLFKACGVLALGGLLFPNEAFWFVLAPVILASLIATVYSYLLFRKYDPT